MTAGCIKSRKDQRVMMKRKLLSILLVLCIFVQIPLYAGAEMQLAGQDSASKSDSELMDVTEYKNTYIQSENYGINTISGDGIQSSGDDLDLPAKYDSRKKGYITSVKNQGYYGTCWAFAAISAAETSILKKGLYTGTNELDLSEMYLAYSFYNRRNDILENTGEDKITPFGTNWLDRGGNSYLTAMFLSQWSNPLLEEEAPYSNIPNDYKEYGLPEYKLQKAIFVPNKVEIIKKHIMEYGSVIASYYSNSSEFSSDSPYYCTSGSGNTNHAITIVGWDDTVSKESFKGTDKPSKDGVWIVKNSWGIRGSNSGYFYMSMSQYIVDIVAFEYMAGDEYDFNYYYDGTVPSPNIGGFEDISSSELKVANIFEAKKGESTLGEYVKGVSVNVASDDTDIEVQIYTNLKDDSDPTSGTPMLEVPARYYVEYVGTYTIPIDELVEVEKGTKFSVLLTLRKHKVNSGNAGIYISGDTSNNLFIAKEHTEPKQSFQYVVNKWRDLHGYQNNYRCVNLKALTVLENKDEQNARKSISEGKVTIEDSEFIYSGKENKPKVSSVTVDGKKLTESVDYEVSYYNNIEAGEAKVRIIGINGYKGVREVPFKISSFPLTDDMVSSIDTQIYNAGYVYPSITVTNGTKVLTQNNDYTINYTNNNKVGTATATIIGKLNYTGSVYKTFNILPCTLEESMMSDIEPQTYTGKSITPSVKVKYKNKTLVKGTDYTVSYGENINIGTGTVKVIGQGNYTGSFTKQFVIKKSEYYTITANAQLGGSITPSGEVSVAEGQDQIFKINADNGYIIEKVVVDGESVGNVSEYKFSSVDSTHTIEAFFTPIKAESIELSDTEITLKEGESHTITATVKPDDTLDKSLLWESSDEDIVSVEEGVVTAKKAGSAVIKVKSCDGSDVSASCNDSN